MGVRPSSFVNPLLWCNNLCLPMYKGHYTTTKNKLDASKRLEMKKYCPNCNEHTLHKESK